MLTAQDIIKLYLVLNKLMYKHALLGRTVYNKTRNPDVDSPNFILLLDLSTAIDMLLESHDVVIYKGESYPFYNPMESQELNKLLDYFSATFELDPVPYLDFPKNTTNFIESASDINLSGDGTALPNGGSPTQFLSKNNSGQLVWKEIPKTYPEYRTTAEWQQLNPILSEGESGYAVEPDGSVRTKVGDNNTTWNNLPYADEDYYPYNDLVTQTNGDVLVGDSLQGRKVVDILKDIVSPYIAPEFTSFKANNQTNFTLEVGSPLASTYNLTWNLSNLSNVEDLETGVISTTVPNVFTNLQDVNLRDLAYTLNSNAGFTYNVPAGFKLNITGLDIKGDNIAKSTIGYDWLGRVRFGVRGTSSITTQNQIQNLSGSFLGDRDALEREYNFNIGYIFIAIPSFIDVTGIKFIDVDNGLNFSIATQNVWDSNLPELISYNNGNTTFDYRIFRGEFYYNSANSVRIEF